MGPNTNVLAVYRGDVGQYLVKIPKHASILRSYPPVFLECYGDPHVTAPIQPSAASADAQRCFVPEATVTFSAGDGHAACA
jgi:hypothetical protein